MNIDWSKGFRIECDGTCAGTNVYDHEGNHVGFLKVFLVLFDADKVMPIVKAEFDTSAYDVRERNDD